MEHVKKLEINKLVKELDFVKSEYEYKHEVLQGIDKEFIDSVNLFLDKYPQLRQVFDEKVINSDQVITTIDTSVIDIVEESESEEIESEYIEEGDTKLRRLYRSIAKSTHPDKLKNESLKELYLEATNAYNSNNLLPILSICDKLRIPYEVTDDETSLIRDEISNIKNRVSFLETTYTWQWYINEDDKMRDEIILSYIKSRIIK